MRELTVFEAKRISGAGVVIGGPINGNASTSGSNGVVIYGDGVGVSIGIGQGANVTIDGRPVSPTSSSKNGVGVGIGRSWFGASKFNSSFFKF